jgi:hypothetical protein
MAAATKQTRGKVRLKGKRGNLTKVRSRSNQYFAEATKRKI